VHSSSSSSSAVVAVAGSSSHAGVVGVRVEGAGVRVDEGVLLSHRGVPSSSVVQLLLLVRHEVLRLLLGLGVLDLDLLSLDLERLVVESGSSLAEAAEGDEAEASASLHGLVEHDAGVADVAVLGEELAQVGRVGGRLEAADEKLGPVGVGGVGAADREGEAGQLVAAGVGRGAGDVVLGAAEDRALAVAGVDAGGGRKKMGKGGVGRGGEGGKRRRKRRDRRGRKGGERGERGEEKGR